MTNGLCGKWRGIGLSVWETAKIFGKWRRSVGNGSDMWGNDLIFWQTKNVLRDLGNGQMGNGLETWCTA